MDPGNKWITIYSNFLGIESNSKWEESYFIWFQRIKTADREHSIDRKWESRIGLFTDLQFKNKITLAQLLLENYLSVHIYSIHIYKVRWVVTWVTAFPNYISRIIFGILGLKRGNPGHILIQNPPSIPSIIVSLLYSNLVDAKFIIDWHNYGYSIMRIQNQNKQLVLVGEIYEKLLARFSGTYNFES